MEFSYDTEGGKLICKVSGKLDSATVGDLEKDIIPKVYVADEVVMDFADLEYISSAGARLLLLIQKKLLKRNGNLYVKNSNDFVLDVFNKTGFTNVFTII